MLLSQLLASATYIELNNLSYFTEHLHLKSTVKVVNVRSIKNVHSMWNDSRSHYNDFKYKKLERTFLSISMG